MTDISSRTDLAVESFPGGKGLPREAEYSSENTGSFTIERMKLSKESGKAFGKPAGNYTTISFGKISELSDREFSSLGGLISSELAVYTKRATGKSPGKELGVLVAGLGNSGMTPDAVGPGTVARLNATSHLKKADPELFGRLGCSRLSAVAPGVLGQTGIETSELVRGAVESVHPDVVIAIDALAAGSCGRLFSTVQLSDSGIFPGSGIGNRRSELSLSSLGVPVHAFFQKNTADLFVFASSKFVDSSTLVLDALERAGFHDIPESLTSVLESGKSYFVAPKECDMLIKSLCRLFASAINREFGVDLGNNL